MFDFNREELHRHNRIHPSLSLECCDRVFNSRRHFRRHTHSVHGPFRPLTCNECHKVFLTKEKLYNHMQRHGEKKQLCTQCGRNFHLKKDLKMHIETVHQCLRKYPCDQCGRHFSTKVTMMRHSSRCGLISGQKRKVRVSAIHSPRPQMWCTECDFRCLRPDTLKRHFDKNHEGFDWELLAQCMCIKCLRQFNTVEQAVEHHAKHHPTLQCDICKTILSSELSLERHKKIHTVKDRPFTCPVCNTLTHYILFYKKLTLFPLVDLSRNLRHPTPTENPPSPEAHRRTSVRVSDVRQTVRRKVRNECAHSIGPQ